MRSRFSAYYLGGFGEYLLSSWHPATVGELTALQLSVKAQDWQRLELLRKSQQGDKAQVEFKAFYLERQQLKVMHENSQFVRLAGRWLYLGGEVS